MSGSVVPKAIDELRDIAFPKLRGEVVDCRRIVIVVLVVPDAFRDNI